jgi:hypothetical protein
MEADGDPGEPNAPQWGGSVQILVHASCQDIQNASTGTRDLRIASQMPLPRTPPSLPHSIGHGWHARHAPPRSPHHDAISCGLIWVWADPFILFAAFCQIEALTSARRGFRFLTVVPQ